MPPLANCALSYSGLPKQQARHCYGCLNLSHEHVKSFFCLTKYMSFMNTSPSSVYLHPLVAAISPPCAFFLVIFISTTNHFFFTENYVCVLCTCVHSMCWYTHCVEARGCCWDVLLCHCVCVIYLCIQVCAGTLIHTLTHTGLCGDQMFLLGCLPLSIFNLHFFETVPLRDCSSLFWLDCWLRACLHCPALELQVCAASSGFFIQVLGIGT